MTSNNTKPHALIYSSDGLEGELVALLTKYGFDMTNTYDPRDFLSHLSAQTTGISFLVVSRAHEKVVSALLKSLRKVLGIGVSLYAVIDPSEADWSKDLVDWGVSGIFLKPIDGPSFIETLQQYAVTDELAVASGNLLLGQGEFSLTESNDKTIAASLEVETIRVQKIASLPDIVSWVFEHIFPVMAGLSVTLENLDQVELRIRFYEELLFSKKDIFIKMIASMKKAKKDEMPDLKQSIRFYGLDNTKFLAVADKLLELTTKAGLPWDEKATKPKEDPKKVIPFAAGFLEFFGDQGIYREVAFNSGLVFDVLGIFSSQAGARKSALKKEIEERTKVAKTKAKAAIQKAKSLENLPLAKHIVTNLMMLEAAKVMMALYYPEYLDFLKTMAKKEIKPTLQHIVEEEKFGISHNLVAALICQVTPGLTEAYGAALFNRYAFVLKGTGKEGEGWATLADICNGV